MGVLLDSVTLEEWRSIVAATVAAAKAGDPSARAWLGQYLVGKPAASAPAPLTVIVQQLSGHGLLVDELAKRHIERAMYPSFGANHDLKARVADELRALEAQKSNTPKNDATADAINPLADPTAS
jgi:hypothetical protein